MQILTLFALLVGLAGIGVSWLAGVSFAFDCLFGNVVRKAREPLPWGETTLFTGPMFAKKTTRACALLARMLHENREATAVIVRHCVDTRSTDNDVWTHGGKTLRSILNPDAFARVTFVKGDDLQECIAGCVPWTDIVFVDEAQFFSATLARTIHELLYDKTVILTGLRATYAQEEWGAMNALMASADNVIVCRADCEECEKPDHAVHTMRRSDVDDTVLIGGKELYYPVCAQCLRIKL